VIGKVIVPGDVTASYLFDLVTAPSGQLRMPPEGEPLTAEEVALLRNWITAGAHWPDDVQLAELLVTDTSWWSFQPIQRPVIAADGLHPVDYFIRQSLAREGLTPAPPADRRTLLRRLSFDLTGLPPSPEEVQEFIDSTDPLAYEQAVERLLASPHYGERWARHWLDIVHFGETHGYDKDKPRPHAWPYRDYVIRAFNQDLPYSQFIEQQLAGDVLSPDTADGNAALGFISAGPWDFIGHVEVPETKIDGRIARHLDRDDMVQNTLGTFCSLTVGCAQCHNHKFDPISQRDYYALQAVFAALDRADREYDADPQIAQRRRELLAERSRLHGELTDTTDEIADIGGDALEALQIRLQELQSAGVVRPPQHGYHSAIAEKGDEQKWVQVDLGREAVIQQVELCACSDNFNGIGDGFGFPVRFRVEASLSPEFSEPLLLLDQTSADFPNTRLQPVRIEAGGITTRYIRVTATQLAPRQNDYILALAELRVLGPNGANLAANCAIQALDSIEAPERWRKTNLTDELYPRQAVNPAEMAAAQQALQEFLSSRIPPELLRRQSALEAASRNIELQLQSLPPLQRVYAGTVHHGSGNFRGTGPDGGRPREIRLLHRGNVSLPGEVVAPAPLSCLPELLPAFQLAEQASEGERRAALARWIAHPDHPLTWRSIVNRVWQYHFGRGLVETPGDFGRMGGLPSHPELLDYLASEFRDGGQSLKQLHRLIVTSETYRQSARHPDAARLDELDPENRWLARFPSRRHDAEVIRDALLAVSGLLDPAMGGPSFQDFVIERPEHSPHYQYHLHDPADPRSHRRSIYRFLVRSQTQPFMTVLDCADPSMQVDRRTQTVSPLQALSQLNDGLVLVCSAALAQRVEQEATGDVSQQIERMLQLTLQRNPSPAEATLLQQLAEEAGTAAVARVLLNLNEFSFLE
jgi:hypothetical protein